MTDDDRTERDQDQVLRVQWFESREVSENLPLLVRFWVDGQWRTLYSILALHDTL